MRAKSKVRQVTDIMSGKLVWSQYPVTLDEAIKEDVAKYWPMTPCPIHGGQPVYFRIANMPGCCVHPAAVDAYNDAVSKGEPTTILQATQNGLDYYWSPMAHSMCGHPGKTLFSGKCAFCKEERDRSPRQLALKAGATWYTPADNDPCTKCHTVAPRRVNNGSCSKCEEVAKTEKATVRQEVKSQEVLPIHKACPDLIMSRKDAKTLGYKVYRTGEPCHAGHRGWRYLSTGVCIDCKNS